MRKILIYLFIYNTFIKSSTCFEVHLSCSFSIANLDDWLTVHRSITLVGLQLDAQLRRRPPEDEQGNARNM